MDTSIAFLSSRLLFIVVLLIIAVGLLLVFLDDWRLGLTIVTIMTFFVASAAIFIRLFG